MSMAWYAASTRPFQEQRAARNLRSELLVYAPRVRVRQTKPDGGFKYVIKPYLHGYVIVRFDIDSYWWPRVNQTLGVQRLVMRGDRPAQIRRGLIESLRRLHGDNDFAVDERALDEAILSVGDTARVLEGPFIGHQGEVSDIELGHIRVGLMLDILGRRSRVSFPNEQLRKVQ